MLPQTGAIWGVDRPVRTYLPVNLDLSLHLPDKYHPYAKFVVGGLYLRRHLEKQREEDDFRPTSSVVLKQVLPRNYRDVLDPLLDGGVIEARRNAAGRESYRAGYECKGYRLADPYRDAKFRSEILTHRELVRKVRGQRVEEQARPRLPVHDHLENQLTRLGVADDYPTVSLPLTCIHDRELFFTPCDQGRIHTPVTNLDRELRPFLRVDGRRLWQVDVTNSQFVTMALTLSAGDRLSRDFNAYRTWLWENRSQKTRRRSSSTTTKPHPAPHTLPYLDTYWGSRQNDAEHFLDICLAGRIYEHLGGLCGYDRETTKKWAFVVAYGQPSKVVWTKVGQAFRREFPSVWRAIERMNAAEHGSLARLMQTVESYLIIRRTCDRIMREWPAAPLLTVHDSLVTDEEHVELFADILTDEYRAVFGVAPRFTTKPF